MNRTLIFAMSDFTRDRNILNEIGILRSIVAPRNIAVSKKKNQFSINNIKSESALYLYDLGREIIR